MSVDVAKVIKLLGTGLSNDVVASAVGCTPGYITQLLSQQEISEQVITLRTTMLTAHNERDATIDTLETTLIKKVSDMVDNNQIYKPSELVRTMALVNNMKRRGIPAHQSLTVNQQVVNITLPIQTINEFTASSTGEVIEVTTDEGRQTLQTMPAKQLLQRLAQDRPNGDKYDKLSKFLPSGPVTGAIPVSSLEVERV